MSNTIGWGKGATNNSIGWGNVGTNGFGSIYKDSDSGDTDLIKSIPPEFILQIDTTLGDGLNQMRMPLQSAQPMTIDWGDGTVETVTQTEVPDSANWVTHTYASAGIYDIEVSNVDIIRFNNEGDKLKPLEVLSWGTYGINQPIQDRSFWGCANLLKIANNGDWFNLATRIILAFTNTNINILPPNFKLTSLQIAIAAFQNVGLVYLPSGMTLESLTDGSNMFSNNTLNTDALSSLYIKMSVLNPNNDVPFHGGSGFYDPAYTEVIDGVTYNTGDARADLVARGWSLTDGGAI